MTRWYKEKKEEFFYQQAKRAGYRARSAYKLKQIQQKFRLITPGAIVVDLGAAPGGWSQVAGELVGSEGMVIGVDILPIKPLPMIQFIQGDITESSTRDQIHTALQHQKADVVLSDMSPDITGHYSMDHARSIWLCQQAFETACMLLKPHGHFICKLFEGSETQHFVTTVKHHFHLVKIFTPPASRKSSSEIYLIAKTFKQR